ncbi:exodeoxyribonuclease VII large subunit [Lentilactobacillus laojiaonis]|uniref:exodeoxyribonuclease VII large subunit n=1 Tax=Lentilactobacillus laojiaonis TaxID=2883998 RepID=UPI001D0A451A|nr:exodeoxyribonuclease VII large subunit [Lentilactobacillus laojiaonis]UDM32637.1 exodeoxyribonuclease VII large subunit [Lentilactobacillus laojiaonis]
MENNYLSVSVLTKYIKRKFDADPYLGKVYLTGEISNFRLRPNSHQYFSLKDEHAKINAIMFKSAFNKIKFQPEEGMKVLVTGHLSVYEPSGSYQIYIDHMEPDGIGQLYQAYEQLKNKLAQEGIFNTPKKQLPSFPKKIAVITSPSGAVIRDIITTVRRRFPITQIVLFPTVVQGDKAALDITNKINQVNELGGFDTMIIGRGGGSIEDLWPFNEEIVARAINDSHIPIISSVGHETDTTIADLVADVRAATPTAAAELAVPKLSQIITDIENLKVRLVNYLNHQIKNQAIRLQRSTNSIIFKNPQRIYEVYSQQVDISKRRLVSQELELLNKQKDQLNNLKYRLERLNPHKNILSNQQQLDLLNTKLTQNITKIMNNKRQDFELLISSLDHLSPLKIMQRGYSYVTNEDNTLINSVNDTKSDDKIKVNLSDGVIEAKVIQISNNEVK